MPIHPAFDDEDESELYVWSGEELFLQQLVIYEDADYEIAARRVAIDERRGLVITQVAALEDLIDEFLRYLMDPENDEAEERLRRGMIGARAGKLRGLLDRCPDLDDRHAPLFDRLDRVIERRNLLAHGSLHPEVREMVPIAERAARDVVVHWTFVDRRSFQRTPVSMAELRENVHEAQSVFANLVTYADYFVENAPWPTHFRDGPYLAAPTP